jgi:hypothetical protein
MGSKSDDFRTPLARLAWSDGLFEPQEDDYGKKWWTCSLLFQKGTDMSELENAALAACEAEWGDKAREWIKNGVIKTPFLDGDGKAGRDKDGNTREGFANTTFIRPKSGLKYEPQKIKWFKGEQGPTPATEKDLYSGCYVYAVLNAFTWDNPKQGKGVSFGLSLVQKVKDGDRMGGGGGVDVKKWAMQVETEAAPASTKGGKGAGGLFS